MIGGRWVVAGWVTVAVVLLASGPAFAEYRRGEIDRTPSKAVKQAAFSLLVPIYEHTTVSDGGWRDIPRTQQNRIAFIGSLVLPLGQNFGGRASIGGGWSKLDEDGDDGIVPFDDDIGDFLVDVSLFRRNPKLGSGGIRYRYNGRTTDLTESSRRNVIGIFGELYVDDFDFIADFGYAFGKADGIQGFTPTPDQDFDGFAFELDARWHMTETFAAVLGLDLEVQNYKFSGSGTTLANIDTFAIGPALKALWLPPLGEKKWIAVEGSFTYQRLTGDVATGGFPRNGKRNKFGAGAVVRVQLPRVTSLKELLREY